MPKKRADNWPPKGYKFELSELRRSHPHWQEYCVVPCKYGKIFMMGRSKKRLVAYVNSITRHKWVSLIESNMPGRIFMETDTGGLWLFPIDKFEDMAKFMEAEKEMPQKRPNKP